MKILIVVDMQEDFMPGGPLPIEKGRQIIDYINKLIPKYDLVISTFDWHPKGHSSFGKYGKHCVQNTLGASPVDGSNLADDFDGLDYGEVKNHLPWFKGFNPEADSTSAFTDEKGMDTGLFNAILSFGVPEVIEIVGVATGICVKDTAMDVLNFPDPVYDGETMEVQVHAKGTACLSDESHEKALEEMEQAGITIIR